MGKKVAHLEGRTKAERKQVRAKIGTLKDLTIQPKTRQRYDKAMAKFQDYLTVQGLALPSQKHLLDQVVSDYLEYIWMEGEGRSLASDTLASLQHFQPSIKGHLVCSWRLLKTWMANELPSRAPPLTEEALHTLVGYALFHCQFQFALSLMMGFYGLLRTGELLSIRNRDIAQSSAKAVAVISLGLTKGGQRTGAAESVTLCEEDTLRRLWQWKQSTSPNTSLCPPPHQWRKMFNEAISALGLESYEYRPYSLRRGGATFFFSKHGQLDRLLIQGRWQSSKTARLYINSGLAILAEHQLKLAPHAKVFHRQFLRAKGSPLPKLEHATRGRAGGIGSKNSKKKSRKQKVKKGSGLDVPRLGGAQCCQQSLAHTHFGLAKGLWGDCERTCSWGRTPGSWNLADFSYIISRNNCLNLTNQVLLCCKKGSNLWILEWTSSEVRMIKL